MAELNTILHVDDDEDILEITRMALQLVDSFDLHQCLRTADALAAVPRVKPDLLLLDYMMPEMSGPELWAAVRQVPGFETVPAIFMTAKAEDRIYSELRDAGALDVVTKPFDPMTLGAHIRSVWAAR